MKKWIKLLIAKWRYRNIDSDLCCCGGQMSESKPWDSICQHGGCRSAKEYAITSDVEKK